ncbi:MoaD family protein [Pyrolobus fumarii 1A]|uniref:MoaD family protein n=1 Tax=Pyrolobus fumarii (strain DSM 11204 / 1A) TaxID=694429 RepID=G0ECT9_PYRF1|nr:MoaD/ThiS family protein [Pyrolobus fumarii]AEM39659.1 MoaD family protein [Pyrolobus fumarii 1A]
MPRVKVVLFAIFREVAGWHERVYDVPEGTTVAQLVEMIFREHPELRKSIEELLERGYSTLILVNGRPVEFLRDGEKTVLRDGDRVALIPPAAGG